MFDSKSYIIPSSLYTKEGIEEVSRDLERVTLPSDLPLSLYLNAESVSVQEDLPTAPVEVGQLLYPEDLPEAWVETVVCYGKKYSSRDETCKQCPLATLCKEAKQDKSEANSKARKLKKELEQEAQELGFTLKGVKKPKGISKHGTKHTCKFNTKCVVSDLPILEGQEMIWIKGWGLFHPDVYEIVRKAVK
jgi:hypothetical protein